MVTNHSCRMMPCQERTSVVVASAAEGVKRAREKIGFVAQGGLTGFQQLALRGATDLVCDGLFLVVYLFYFVLFSLIGCCLVTWLLETETIFWFKEPDCLIICSMITISRVKATSWISAMTSLIIKNWNWNAGADRLDAIDWIWMVMISWCHVDCWCYPKVSKSSLMNLCTDIAKLPTRIRGSWRITGVYHGFLQGNCSIFCLNVLGWTWHNRP